MAAMLPRWGAGIVPSYDAIAEEYAEKFFDELDGKPFRAELGRAVAEIHRVLLPGGRLLMTVHAGEGEVGRDEAYGKRVARVATLFSEDEVRAALTAVGFRIDEVATRDPYPFEYPSRRVDATATRA